MEFEPITYIIEKDEYYNDYGNLTHTTYFIKWRKSFFGLFTYWKYVTHTNCDTSGTYSSRTNWNTEEEAIKFIKDVLCPGKKYDGWATTTVNEITCS